MDNKELQNQLWVVIFQVARLEDCWILLYESKLIQVMTSIKSRILLSTATKTSISMVGNFII